MECQERLPDLVDTLVTIDTTRFDIRWTARMLIEHPVPIGDAVLLIIPSGCGANRFTAHSPGRRDLARQLRGRVANVIGRQATLILRKPCGIEWTGDVRTGRIDGAGVVTYR
jgi:hypothetical protein